MKAFERLFFAIYIPLGIWGCLHAGISWDELAEYQTLLINLGAVKGLWSGSYAEYQSLLNYGDRYYGIGFHVISNVIAKISLWANSYIFTISNTPSEILFTHLSVFLAFVLSGLLVNSILEKITDSPAKASLGMIVYLLWPYLLGHSFVNVKDIPFLFAWLLCTNIYLRILQLWYLQFLCSKKRALLEFFLLGLATAWLLSIRISGILIFIEYAAFFLVYLLLGNCRLRRVIGISHLVAFGLPFTFGVFVLYPVFWHNPLEVVNAIQYMSQHPWDGDTLTAGKFLAPRQLSYFYISAWLLVKLPLVTLLGLMLIPLVFYRKIKKIQYPPVNLQFINFVALFASVVLVLLTLVVLKAGLYNELRQILFIFPLIYILGFAGFYFISQKILTVALVATAVFFVADNFALYPYSYVYMNEASRKLDIGSKYEKDYLGLSISRTTAWLNHQDLSHLNATCTVVTPAHLWTGLEPSKYPCVRGYENFPNLKQPFLFSWLIRDRIDLLPLPSCKLIHEEQVSLPLSRLTLVMSQLFFCDPSTSEK